MKATTQVEAIPEPMELVVRERKDHVFTPNALIAPTAEAVVEKTMEHSVPRDLVPTYKVVAHLNKGSIAHVITITTMKVVAISNAITTTITIAEATNSDKRAAIVHVTTTLPKAKEATNNVPTTNLGRKVAIAHAKKEATNPTKRVAISNAPTINHVKKEAIVHVITTRKEATNNAVDISSAVDITTIAVAINNAAVTTTTVAATNKVAISSAVVINNVAGINKAAIANVRPTTPPMLNTALKSV